MFVTVRGIELPSRLVWLFAALAGVVALGFVFLQAGSNGSVGAEAPTGSLSCDATDLTYGDALTCDAALGAGRLVRPYPEQIAVRAGYCIAPRHGAAGGAALAFIDWVEAALAR